MKYFTPELLERFGSDDPAIYKAAEAEWDEQCERYNNYLNSVKDTMPAGLRAIEENYYLHDAVIQAIGQRGLAFTIIMQLDNPPYSLLTVTYDLVEEPVIKQGVLSPERCTPNTHVEWRYAEIECRSTAPPTWLQSVLLSNGWEVLLHFRNVDVQQAKAMLPVPRDASAVGAQLAISQSAALATGAN
jgi:hypothetical protein